MRRGRPPYPDLLTPREQEVLALLREGLTNQQIADRLGISLYGARYHVSEILSKLGVSSREEAATWGEEAAVSHSRFAGLFGLAVRLGGISPARMAATGAIGAAGIALVVLAFGVVVAQSREPQAGDFGKVAYVVEGNIWVKELPDGVPLQVTFSGSDLAPEWSPSGEWLSFAREIPPAGATEMWVVRADGTDARLAGGGPMSWSPVEDRYAHTGTDFEGLVVEDADGSHRVVVVPRPDDPYDVNPFGYYYWSPDGQWIAFTDSFGLEPGSEFTDPRYSFVYRVPSSGGKPTEIYRQVARTWDTAPADEVVVDIRPHGWSPDGRTFLLSQSVVTSAEHEAALAERRQEGDGRELKAISVADGTVTDTGLRSQAFLLPPSPVTNEVLIVSGIDFRTWLDRRIVLVEPGSGESQLLTAPESAAIDPSWSPDGSAIAYAVAPAGPDSDWDTPEAIAAFSERRIWLMNADGSGQRPLTNDPAYRDEQPHWTPDENHILFARVDVREPSTNISLWLLDLRNGATELVADDIFTSPARLMGRTYDVRTDDKPHWGQLFDYWKP